MSSGQLSRRAFLGAFALGTSAALLSACGAPATPAVAPTAPPAKPAATSVSVAGTAPAASGQPKSGGTLTAGKDADLAVLAPDPFHLEAAALLEASVQLTMVGGRIVYDGL